jgi:hypothetical protein
VGSAQCFALFADFLRQPCGSRFSSRGLVAAEALWICILYSGMIENVWNGLLLGALYLACGRNIAVPVIAHAFTDTLDFTLIYLGKYPGMH